MNATPADSILFSARPEQIRKMPLLAGTKHAHLYRGGFGFGEKRKSSSPDQFFVPRHTHTDNPPRILSGPRALSRALLSSCLFICMHIRYTSRPISVDEGPLVPLYACGCIIASDAHRPGDPSTLAAPSRAGNGVLAARYCTGPETALCTGATTAPNENECPLSARSPFFLILRSLRPSHFHSARRER